MVVVEAQVVFPQVLDAIGERRDELCLREPSEDRVCLGILEVGEHPLAKDDAVDVGERLVEERSDVVRVLPLDHRGDDLVEVQIAKQWRPRLPARRVTSLAREIEDARHRHRAKLSALAPIAVTTRMQTATGMRRHRRSRGCDHADPVRPACQP